MRHFAKSIRSPLAAAAWLLLLGSASRALAVPVITTTSPLPSSTAGIAYSQMLMATGAPPFNWTIIAGALPSGLALTAGTGLISGTPTPAATFNFTVQVTDASATSATRAFSLTINPALAITTPSPLAPGTAGTPLSRILTATGGTAPLGWSIIGGALPAGLSINSLTGLISGTPTMSGSFPFTVRVNDSVSGSANRAFTLTINPPPAITTAAALSAGTVGTAYTRPPLAATGGTPPLSWSVSVGSLPTGLTLNAGTGQISGTPLAAGTFNFTARVTDSLAAAATRDFTLTINPALLITTGSPLPGGTAGRAYSQSLAATGGTLPLSWSISSGSLPPGLTLNPASGLISGTPTTPGGFSFNARVTDSVMASATRSYTLAISAAPAITTTSPLGPGTATAPYSTTLAATGGTPPLTWSITSGSLPAGLTLTAGTGLIGGTPTTAGMSSFTAQVTDSLGASASRAFSLTINNALAITTTSPLVNGVVGSLYSQTLTASGGTLPLSWAITAGTLPAGLGLNAGAGQISGTPIGPGVFTFTARVGDSASASATRVFTLTIQTAPSILTVTLPNWTVGTLYSQGLAATGGTPPYTWSVNVSTLPPGLGLSPSGAVSGTPLIVGVFNFAVQVVDAATLASTRAFSIVISPPPSISTGAALLGGVVGAPYAQTLIVVGGTPLFTWSVAGGSLPPGLGLNSSTGTIGGTPSSAGSFGFTIQATDAALVTTSKAFTLAVTSTLTVTTAPALPGGTAGVLYSQSLGAAGGTPPYVWSVASGSPPAGLTLNPSTGVLSGSPSAAGSFSFTIQVADSASVTATRLFTVSIASSLTIVTAPSLGGGTVGIAYSQDLVAAGGTPPYIWSIIAGALPAGFALNPFTGQINGTSPVSGSFSFTAQVTDSASVTVTKAFTLTIAAGLNIVTAPALPAGTVGVPYSQSLTAAGGTFPYNWSITSGAPPAGLILDGSSGLISGTPAVAGNFSFTVRVADQASVATTKAFILTIVARLTISSAPSLPAGTLAGAYSVTLAAIGGAPPYTWSVISGTLPAGVTLSAGGQLSGSPATAGTFSFTLQVSDSFGATATASYALVVELPPAPVASLTGLADTVEPLQQPRIELALAAGYPVPITGQVTLSFEPDAVVGGDDPAVQFSTGGRVANFGIPANAVRAQFATPDLALQTGSVAGVIRLSVSMQAAGVPLTPPPARAVRIPRAAPVIRSLRVTRTPNGLEATIIGLATPREITEAVFRFIPAADANLQTTQLTVPLGDAARRWYQDTASAPFGSQFRLTQPFTIQGDASAVRSVSVTLSNSQGASQPASADLP